MATVLLVIHIMIAAALVGLVLLQRSEGGALGIGGGGGGGGGGFMSGRGTANLLTRVTALFAAMFFVTSILLTLVAQREAGTGGTGLDRFILPDTPGQSAPGEGTSPLEGLQLPTEEQPQAPQTPQAPQGPQVPQSQ